MIKITQAAENRVSGGLITALAERVTHSRDAVAEDASRSSPGEQRHNADEMPSQSFVAC